MELWEWAGLIDEVENMQEVDRFMKYKSHKRTKKRKNRSKLETKVFRFRPLRDKEGRYVPFCDFGYHQGYVKTPEICEERKCQHYNKLYIPK